MLSWAYTASLKGAVVVNRSVPKSQLSSARSGVGGLVFGCASALGRRVYSTERARRNCREFMLSATRCVVPLLVVAVNAQCARRVSSSPGGLQAPDAHAAPQYTASRGAPLPAAAGYFAASASSESISRGGASSTSASELALVQPAVTNHPPIESQSGLCPLPWPESAFASHESPPLCAVSAITVSVPIRC